MLISIQPQHPIMNFNELRRHPSYYTRSIVPVDGYLNRNNSTFKPSYHSNWVTQLDSCIPGVLHHSMGLSSEINGVIANQVIN